MQVEHKSHCKYLCQDLRFVQIIVNIYKKGMTLNGDFQLCIEEGLQQHCGYEDVAQLNRGNFWQQAGEAAQGKNSFLRPAIWNCARISPSAIPSKWKDGTTALSVVCILGSSSMRMVAGGPTLGSTPLPGTVGWGWWWGLGASGQTSGTSRPQKHPSTTHTNGWSGAFL